MAVLYSDCFECYHSGKGFIVATTRASICLSVLFFPLHYQCFTSEPFPRKSAANSAELSVEFSTLSFL